MRFVRALLAICLASGVTLAGTMNTRADSAVKSRTAVQPAQAAAETFELHSKPGAARTIFLDFDGHDVAGTAWNQDPDILLPERHYLGYRLETGGDISPSVEKIWTQVADDFAPFDVDVTTQNPGGAALNRNSVGDQVFGTRVLITSDDDAWAAICSSTCRGRAYPGVFDSVNSLHYQPVWVFPEFFSYNAPGDIADVVSHEVGHTLGLAHDGTSTSELYEGGTDHLWGSLMGYPRFRAISQWSQGDYPDANNHEDDLAVIAAGGAPLRDGDDDEAGDSIATAAAALPADRAYISSRTDVDYYSIGFCYGRTDVQVRAADYGPNLDIEAWMINASGAVLHGGDPPSGSGSGGRAAGMDVVFVHSTVPPGNYFIAVDGVGHAPYYDDYGSLGAYTLTVSCSTVGFPPPAPENLAAHPAANSASMILERDPPADGGGGPVTSYYIRWEGGYHTRLVGANVRSVAIGHLLPGRSYEFTVEARSAAGAGPRAFVSGTTHDYPGVPTAVTAVRDGIGAVIEWAPPGNDGGTPVTGYQVRLKDGAWVALPAEARSHAFAEVLQGGQVYQVRARNALGFGTAVTRTLEATSEAPSEPRNLTVIPADQSVSLRVRWEPPASTGAGPITGYRISIPGRAAIDVAPDQVGKVVTGLDPSTRYRVTVVAINSAGTGREAVGFATTKGYPSAPRDVTGTANPTSISWTVPYLDGGSPITGYQVRIDWGEWINLPPSARTYTFAFPAEYPYSLVVRARNALGFGAAAYPFIA